MSRIPTPTPNSPTASADEACSAWPRARPPPRCWAPRPPLRRPPPPRRHAVGRGRPVLPPGRLGIQLYSLRDKVSTLGFAAVFAELEKYGYDEVEFAGYTQGSAGPITLAQLRRLARDHGLNPIGSHVGYYSDDPNAYTFAQNLTKVLDDAQALGLKHIGTASGPFRYGSTVDAWKRAAEEFNTYGAAARARGMKFYQHNHSDEFSFATDNPRSGSTTYCSPRPTPTWCSWRWTSSGRTRASSASPSGPTVPPRPSSRWTTYCGSPPLPALPREGRRSDPRTSSGTDGRRR